MELPPDAARDSKVKKRAREASATRTHVRFIREPGTSHSAAPYRHRDHGGAGAQAISMVRTGVAGAHEILGTRHHDGDLALIAAHKSDREGRALVLYREADGSCHDRAVAHQRGHVAGHGRASLMAEERLV